MTIREELEEEESRFLSKYATLSRDSVGRERLEAEDDLRPCFSAIAIASCTVRRFAV